MLESAIALLQAVLVFVVGLVLRVAIAVAIIAAIALPIAGLLLAWRGAQRLGERASGLGQVGPSPLAPRQLLHARPSVVAPADRRPTAHRPG